MEQQELKAIIEAALMAADEPLSLKRLQALFDEITVPAVMDIRQAIAQLQQDYQTRSLALVEVASGFRFQIKPEYAAWVMKLWDMKPARYSRALLETLALVAYKQPITRAEIEDIRGVSVSSQIIKTLLEHEWIKIIGHKDVPGKPAIFATTKNFLDFFNLKSLEELPPLADILDLDKAGDQLQIQLQAGQDIAAQLSPEYPVEMEPA